MADETRTIAWQLVVETKGIEQNTARAAGSLDQLTGSVKTLYAGLAAIAAGTIARGLVDFGDTFTRVQNSIRLATTSTAEFAATQRALTQSALDSSTPLETVATNYQRLRSSLESYRVTGRDVITVSDTITKAVKLQGGSAEMAEDAVRRMAKAFDVGTISQRELKSMLDSSRPLVQALADALTDGSIPALQKMAKEGDLTGQKLLSGLGGAADQINAKFKQRVTPLSEAFTNLKTTLLDVFGDAVAKQIQEIADNLKAFGEKLPEIIATFQELGIRVKYGWQLTLADVRNLWEILKAYVVKYIADIGALLVSLIPDWAANMSPQVAAFKKHYTELSTIKQADLAASQKKYQQELGFITVNMNTELKGIKTNAAARKAADEQILGKQLEGTGGGGDGGAKAASEFEKALASLQNQLDSVRDKSAALTIEITKGAAASQEYTIRAEARRKVEEQIITQAQAGKPFTEAEVAVLYAKSAAVAEANVQLAKYQNANKLVQEAIALGTTDAEKAAKKVSDMEAAYAELTKRVKLTDEQVRQFNLGLEEQKKKADPARQAMEEYTKYIQAAGDEAEKLAIQQRALAVQLTSGQDASRAYATAAEAELAVRIKIRQDAEKHITYTKEEEAAMYAAAKRTADARTANEQYAQGIRLVNDALAFGQTQQEAMAFKIKETNEAMAAMGLPDATVKAVNDQLAQMARAADPLSQRFADAAKNMTNSLVDFVVNGTQSFSEFAASVISDIGSMIAKFYMLKALEAAFGGTSWASMFKVGAQGMVVNRGNVVPFQHGGVVTGPTAFPLRGARGLMGEAGPEAVMPLARLAGGDLGVKAQPMNLQVVNNTGVNATARVRQDQDRTQVILDAAELGAAWAQSRFNTSVTSGYGASATNMQRTYGLTRRKA